MAFGLFADEQDGIGSDERKVTAIDVNGPIGDWFGVGRWTGLGSCSSLRLSSLTLSTCRRATTPNQRSHWRQPSPRQRRGHSYRRPLELFHCGFDGLFV